MTAQISKQMSKNINMVKVIAIITVATSHFMKGIPLWPLASMALVVFAYTSAYFTWVKYHGDYSVKRFWTNKFKRLLVNLSVINLFLLIVFLIERRSGIWTWHTLINILGFNGFLNWFRIKCVSPFGMGMWFFTLLILFYITYPLIEKMNKQKIMSYSFLGISLIILLYLGSTIIYGIDLWKTTAGFFVGVFCARHDVRVPKKIAGWLAIIGLLTMFVVGLFFKIHYLYPFIIIGTAIFFLNYIREVTIPKMFANPLIFFSGCVLEIYLIHTYLFVHPMQGGISAQLVNLGLSLVIILAVAKTLEWISVKISHRLFGSEATIPGRLCSPC